jgi:hypothetical protein
MRVDDVAGGGTLLLRDRLASALLVDEVDRAASYWSPNRKQS